MKATYRLLVLLLLLLAGLPAGCSGGKGFGSLSGTGGATAPARPQATARFVITIPLPGSLGVKHISPATKSLTIGLTGNTTGNTTVNVTSGVSTYTVDVKAFAGENTFNVNLFDGPDGGGNLLSTARVTATLTVNKRDVVKVATAGVPASIQLSLDITSLRAGLAATVHLTVAALDASGSTIVGPYSQSVNLTNTDTSGKITLASASVSQPGSIDVKYNGGNVGMTTLGASVSGVAPGNVTNAVLTLAVQPNSGVVTTLAGRSGFLAQFDRNLSFSPKYVAVDRDGNIYVTDILPNAIRKITAAGQVSILAVRGLRFPLSFEGTGTGQFLQPLGLTVDASGNLYVTDSLAHRIRKVTTAGLVTTLAGGTLGANSPPGIVLVPPGSSGTQGTADGPGGTVAQFSNPNGITVDSSGNLYVADFGNNTIRKIDTNNVVSTLAGATSAGFADGSGTGARFNGPRDLTIGSDGNIYVVESGNHTVRKVTPAGEVTTLAGNGGTGASQGVGAVAQFNQPSGITADGNGNLYVADKQNHRIRKLTLAGKVTTLAGSGTAGALDGQGANARFFGPNGIAMDGAGNLLVTDVNPLVRKVTPAGEVTSLAGAAIGFSNGNGTASAFNQPNGIAVDGDGNLYVADRVNNMIRKISRAGVVTTLAGQSTSGSADGTGANSQFNVPVGIAVDGSGDLFVDDAGNKAIRKVTPDGVVTTLASGYRFNSTRWIAVDGTGVLYVTDPGSSAVLKVTQEGAVTTLAGGTSGTADGSGAAAQFTSPAGIAVDGAGNVYVANLGLGGYGSSIRKVTPAGVVTTLAGGGLPGPPVSADGSGTAAQFTSPTGIAVDSAGNVYVTEQDRVRMVTPVGVATTLAGSTAGFADGQGTSAAFNGPAGIAVDFAGLLYVGDAGNHLIRKIQ